MGGRGVAGNHLATVIASRLSAHARQTRPPRARRAGQGYEGGPGCSSGAAAAACAGAPPPAARGAGGATLPAPHGGPGRALLAADQGDPFPWLTAPGGAAPQPPAGGGAKGAQQQQQPAVDPFPVIGDKAQPPAARAAALVSRLTRGEKLTLLHNHQRAVPRLGLPAYEFLNGARPRAAGGGGGGGADARGRVRARAPPPPHGRPPGRPPAPPPP